MVDRMGPGGLSEPPGERLVADLAAGGEPEPEAMR